MAITKVTNSVVSSGSAADGYVLTADGSGNSAWEEAGGGAVSAVTNGADNRIATFSSSTALNGEANLTFTGTAFTAQSTGALTSEFKSLINSNNALNLTTTGGITAGIFLAAPTTDHSFGFQTAGTERMRIDSSGNLLIGTTTASSSSTETGLILGDGFMTCRSADQAGIFKRTSSNGIIFIFRNTANVRVGTISTSASSTSYNTTSDYRLKENVSYNWDATTRLKQLKPARFNFTEDETNTVVDGFLAHEVSDIVPEAISGEKDAVDEDGNPDYQGIDQSKLVPLLTKALQEQQTIIEDLQARIETLENA